TKIDKIIKKCMKKHELIDLNIEIQKYRDDCDFRYCKFIVGSIIYTYDSKITDDEWGICKINVTSNKYSDNMIDFEYVKNQETIELNKSVLKEIINDPKNEERIIHAINLIVNMIHD